MKNAKQLTWARRIIVSILALHPGAGAQSSFPDTSLPASQSLPPALLDVGIDEHLGETIPLDAAFLAEDGSKVELSRYFGGSRPVLFNFAYYRCPMLCNLVLAGMVDGMKGLVWTPGKEFEVVTLSIDPRDGPEQAQAKKNTHIDALGRPESAHGWHFLTGKPEQIKRLTRSLGFNYRYNQATGDFSHAAAIFAISPQGKICRYLYGVQYPPKDLRLALLEAKEGRELSIGDKVLLFCYHYDANAKGYVLLAQNTMRAGGYLVLLAMLSLLGGLWYREARKRKSHEGSL
jgi:protein SCO1/2